MKAPFPYFGGKSSVAPIVWAALGTPKRYIEPFAGSAAVLLARPNAPNVNQYEIINDLSGGIVNFWRALKAEPDTIASLAADWPVSELDEYARKCWLIDHEAALADRLRADPEYYDAKLAAWWVYVQCNTLGSSAFYKNKSIIQINNKKGVMASSLAEGRIALHGLSDRLRCVLVTCGSWERVITRAALNEYDPDLCGIFLDPPYATKVRDTVYAHDCTNVAHDVREWAKQHAHKPYMRIALAGYDGEHNELEGMGWTVHAWKAQGGYGNLRKNGTNENKHKERIWFSPHCLPLQSTGLF